VVTAAGPALTGSAGMALAIGACAQSEAARAPNAMAMLRVMRVGMNT
jgi:hypothetical protein